jgi:hypothetical protein
MEIDETYCTVDVKFSRMAKLPFALFLHLAFRFCYYDWRIFFRNRILCLWYDAEEAAPSLSMAHLLFSLCCYRQQQDIHRLQSYVSITVTLFMYS